MASVNGSFASPAADATVTPRLFQAGGLVSSYLEGLNAWKAILTLFLAAVIYDQSEWFSTMRSFLSGTPANPAG